MELFGMKIKKYKKLIINKNIFLNIKKNELPYLLYQETDLEQTNTSLAWARNYGIWILILTFFFLFQFKL